MIQEDRDRAQTAFLLAFVQNGLVGVSAKEAGVTVRTVRDWIEKDADFAAMYEDAKAEADDIIRQVIHRRAFGYEEPLHFHGRLTGDHIERFSETALALLARSRLPEFRTQHHRVEVAVNYDDVRDAFLGRIDAMVQRLALESGTSGETHSDL